jgi:hypothetical protein
MLGRHLAEERAEQLVVANPPIKGFGQTLERGHSTGPLVDRGGSFAPRAHGLRLTVAINRTSFLRYLNLKIPYQYGSVL